LALHELLAGCSSRNDRWWPHLEAARRSSRTWASPIRLRRGRLDDWRSGRPGRRWRPGGHSIVDYRRRRGGLEPDADPNSKKDSAEEAIHLVALRFRNMKEGIVAAAVQHTEGRPFYRFVSCFTLDGGKTWRFSQFNASEATPSIGDKHIFWSVDGVAQKVHLRTESEPVPFTLPAGASSEGFPMDIDFVDDSNAWIRYGEGPRNLLMAPTDGGKSSQLIWPGVISEGSASESSTPNAPR
jgi:hypothetical protein